jgi:putative FmdB family regulatory protein
VPTYQYACTACDERLEVVQKFTDDPLTDCPVCGGRLRKVFSAVGVVFKGAGFYRTDSREKPKSASASSSNGSSDSSPSSTSESSSAKADGKAASSSSESGSKSPAATTTPSSSSG